MRLNPDRARVVLPGVSELYKRYERFALMYFDGKVPPAKEVTIEWSGRLTRSAGICIPVKRIIRLSTHYHVTYPGDVDETLIHEMIHLLVPNHGPRFYAWMEEIRRRGGKVNRHSKARATPRKERWLYSCVGCNMEKRTARRYPQGGKMYRCGRCGGKLAERSLVR